MDDEEEFEEPVEKEEVDEDEDEDGSKSSEKNFVPPEYDILKQPDSVVRKVIKELWDSCDVASPFTMDLWTDKKSMEEVLPDYLNNRVDKDGNPVKNTRKKVQEEAKDEAPNSSAGFDLQALFGKSSLVDIFQTIDADEKEDPEYSKNVEEGSF